MGFVIILNNSCKKDGDNGSNTVTDIDGNVYHTITVGTQVWMVENLKVTKYSNGDGIPNITDNTQWGNLITGAYCNNNNLTNANAYGRLYNEYAVNDSRNLAPTGWHVATAAEFDELITYLGGTNVGGGKMKEAGNSHWVNPNTGATNESSFTALPGGFRSNDGTFIDVGDIGIWWSSTEYIADNVWYYEMNYNDTYVHKVSSFKGGGFSVRCIRDNAI